MTEFERFMSKVKQDGDGGCWEWRGGRNSGGYGIFFIGSRRDGTRRIIRAHRYAYQRFVGKIPDGLQLDHLCRNRGCVNPKHLEAVSRAENIRRGNGFSAMNARKTYCKNGHEFNAKNTYVGKDGWRKCRACRAIQQRGYDSKKHQKGVYNG